jgi:hypothetical protein
MRVPNPRLIRLAAVTRGAILEQGDGELLVTPVMQPVIELVSPIPKVYPNSTFGGTQEDSFYLGSRLTQVGVVAGLTNSALVLMSRGAWVLEVSATFGFVATVAQPTILFGLILSDPAGNNADLIGIPWGTTPNSMVTMTRVLHVSFQVDGFSIGINSPTTAAGESLGISYSVNARRIL